MNSIMPQRDVDLGFSFQRTKNGEVRILRHARVVTILRATVASAFLANAEGATFAGRQQLMARLTGNYKRGNERHARNSSPNDA